jgi:AcrR family transcriptional regulator
MAKKSSENTSKAAPVSSGSGRERTKGGAAHAHGRTGSSRSKRSDGRETRARVLRAATEVFARDGFEGASLRRIADRAGIDIATL